MEGFFLRVLFVKRDFCFLSVMRMTALKQLAFGDEKEMEFVSLRIYEFD